MADTDRPGGTGEMLPLARFRGQRPPAPDWFETAIAVPCEDRHVEVDGAQIHYRRWGNPDLPGLLLVHGNGAHAHWYDFIAPAFMDTHCVVAMTFGGMGDSDHRGAYDLETFAAEQLAVCADAGLTGRDTKPIMVAHSFGGFVALATGAEHSDMFDGIMIVDSHISAPDEEDKRPPPRSSPNRIYPSFEAALARFRLAPAQPCDNDFIVDYIGRHSLKEVTLQDGRKGWTWKFDSRIWQHFQASRHPRDMVGEITCPLAFIRGTDSVLVTDAAWDYLKSLRPDVPMHSIDGAQHHVLLDQPHAFIETVQRQLDAWSGKTV